ncbi:MAG: tetratricopeptide repeat protein [Chlamydiae bacterium]|nr:tetratricopeptide repeat protein [Chlamydiota bacterium]MBI3266902.1 tetratricopeptide repeat protein [Chlamydiota bacterium]
MTLSKKHLFSLLFIVVVILIAYANSFQNHFVWDDDLLIVQNQYLQSPHHISNFFTENIFKGSDHESNFWRPLQLISFFMDQKIWGANAYGFHLTNLLLHILASLEVYLFIFLLFRRKGLALLTSLLWALHPIQTEAVTYISGRADPLAAYFILSSLCLYLYHRQRASLLAYLGSLISFVLALLSKEMALMLPVYLMLFETVLYQKGEKKFWNIFLRLLPFISIVSLYISLRLTVLNFSDSPLIQDNPFRLIPLPLRLLTFTKTLFGISFNSITHHWETGYFWLLLFPFNLHMERSTAYAKSFFQWPYLSTLILFGIWIFALFRTSQKSKLQFFGLTLFLIALLPFSDLIPLNANMAEHWLYIPSIGIFLILSDLVFQGFKKYPITVSCLFIPYLLYLGTTTYFRNQDWKDEMTIWQQTAELSQSSHIHGNLAVAYGRQGNLQKAEKELKKAVALQFNYPEAHNNLGLLYIAKGNLTEALQEFSWAIQFNPTYSNAYKNLGDVYEAMNNLDEAKKMWKKALEINPMNEGAKEKLKKSSHQPLSTT